MAGIGHVLRLEHRRKLNVSTFGEASAESTVDIEAESMDLVEAWRELLSRLPSDLYAGLKEAMGEER